MTISTFISMLLFLSNLIFMGCLNYYYDWDYLVIVVNLYYLEHRKKTAKVLEGHKPINSQAWKTVQSSFFLQNSYVRRHYSTWLPVFGSIFHSNKLPLKARFPNFSVISNKFCLIIEKELQNLGFSGNLLLWKTSVNWAKLQNHYLLPNWINTFSETIIM